MESGRSTRSRKRRIRADDSLISDFLELRDGSIVQTGPKRPRQGAPVLTPAPTSLTEKGSGRGSRDRRKTPRTELAEAARDLIEGATDMSELTPGPPSSTHPPLTPTPASSRTPRRSPRIAASPSVAETPVEDGPLLRSALKGVRSLSSLRRPPPSSSRQVSFMEHISVAEYSPEYRTSTSREDAYSPEYGDQSTSVSVSREEGGGAGSSGPAPSPHLEPIGDEDESGEGSEEEGSEEEEEEEERSGRALKTPHLASEGEKSSPKLDTPAYTEFRPVRKTKASPERRRNAPTKSTRPPHGRHKPVKTLPRSLIKNLFMLSCKKRVTKDAMDLVMKFTEVYLRGVSEDVAVYAAHGGRRTVEVGDVALLLRRQRVLTESHSFEYLTNTHLPLEYVEELLPCAVAGKRIEPGNTQPL